MRTAEEMVLAVHQRIDVLQRKRENRRTVTAGLGCLSLTGIMLILIVRFSGTKHKILTVDYSGASLLADDAGGYVLVALVSFMAGAAVALFLRARRNKEQKEGKKQRVSE